MRWLEYIIKYSKRRTVAIEISRGGDVIVRAPYGFSTRSLEKLLAEKSDWILIHREKQLKRSRFPDDPDVIEKLRRAAKAELIPKTYEMASRYGFSVKHVKISSARSRFGSCSAENGISLSLFLMLYPESAREYVIMHELCHTVEHNHSPRFYTLLEKRMPDHKERRRLLSK